MAFYLNDDLEDRIQDHFDMVSFEENSQQKHSEDSEEEDHANEKTDTSAEEYRKGKDIQGIPWENLNHSRGEYRVIRLNGYQNYENIPRSENESEMECQMVERGHTFYDFQFNTRLVKPTIVHFQWAHGSMKNKKTQTLFFKSICYCPAYSSC